MNDNQKMDKKICIMGTVVLTSVITAYLVWTRAKKNDDNNKEDAENKDQDQKQLLTTTA